MQEKIESLQQLINERTYNKFFFAWIVEWNHRIFIVAHSKTE